MRLFFHNSNNLPPVSSLSIPPDLNPYNESYQRGEKDLEKFTGIKVSHSTLERLVKRQDFEWPTSKQGVQEITLDGEKSGYAMRTGTSHVIGKIIKLSV